MLLANTAIEQSQELHTSHDIWVYSRLFRQVYVIGLRILQTGTSVVTIPAIEERFLYWMRRGVVEVALRECFLASLGVAKYTNYLVSIDLEDIAYHSWKVMKLKKSRNSVILYDKPKSNTSFAPWVMIIHIYHLYHHYVSAEPFNWIACKTEARLI